MAEEVAEEDVPPEFECSICMKLLLEPVTVSCGHTFCRECLDKSLGYRGLCAVCRAPVVAGQGVNILVRTIISERFPRALATRNRESQEELRAAEREADEARRREAEGGAAQEPNRAAAGAAAGPAAPVLPLLQGFDFRGTALLPHGHAEVELRSESDERMVEYALQGGRRIGALDGPAGGFDDGARPLGVCFEIERVERSAQRRTRLKVTGKFRFWLVEAPQRHELGFDLGRCEPFFDEPLSAHDLRSMATAAAAEAPAEGDTTGAPDERRPMAEVACGVLDLLEAQLGHVGHGGRSIFVDRFGDPPAPPGPSQAMTSASLERLSFWLLGVILTDAAERRRWLGSVDSRARLEHVHMKLETAGRRPTLNLPGAGSWMSPGQSAFSSLALLVVIVALLVAKAFGVFESGAFRRLTGGGGGSRYYEREGTMQEAIAFQQLLR